MTTHRSESMTRCTLGRALAMTLLLVGWGWLAMGCSGEDAPQLLTLSITSDPPKSGELDGLRFLFTDGDVTWPESATSADGNKELSSSTNPVEAAVVVEIDYQGLDNIFSTDVVTLQVSGTSGGLLKTSFEGLVTLSAKEVVEVHLTALEDNCDVDQDGFLDCTVPNCCSDTEMVLSDCEPNDPNANPFATEDPCEPCSDEIDNDCQGGDAPCVDNDEDGAPDCQETADDSGCPEGAELDGDIYPGHPELCDGKDNDCDGETDETFVLTSVIGTPGIGDPCGLGACEGPDPDNNPMLVVCDGLTAAKCEGDDLKGVEDAQEPCLNGIDDDCDGITDEGCDQSDLDGDGFTDDDCHPEDASSYPGAAETCCLLGDSDPDNTNAPCSQSGPDDPPCLNGLDCVQVDGEARCLPRRCDRNCDGAAELCSANDGDGDGQTPPNDCDDTDPLSYVGAPERCGDGIDQDCSGADLSCDGVLDEDGDGWSPPTDCDDTDDDTNPSEAELCDGLDNDCNGFTDDGNPETNNTAPCGSDTGECLKGLTICVSSGELGAEVQCVGQKGPETDLCNDADDDCDGQTDEDFKAGGGATLTDLDGAEGLTLGDDCGTGVCLGGVVECGPGEASLSCATHWKANPELCNGLDDDCDGQTDEDFSDGGSVTINDTGGTGDLSKGDDCGTGACQGGFVD
ncbi:MAG: putative metal-binding motif-containing protein, partial [Myxococcota bacterium]|nr:putative metal-binding motif-containing protein [Myxococcota bacterium]